MDSKVDPKSMEALYQRPGFIIRRAQQITLAIFDEAASDLGITTTQYSVLHTLRAWPQIDQVTLCALIGIDRSTATLVLTLLEKNGLVDRLPDATDRRRKQLVLTAQGRQLLDDAAPLSAAVSGRMREVLSADEIAQMCQLLARYVDAFNDQVRNPLVKGAATIRALADPEPA